MSFSVVVQTIEIDMLLIDLLAAVSRSIDVILHYKVAIRWVPNKSTVRKEIPVALQYKKTTESAKNLFKYLHCKMFHMLSQLALAWIFSCKFSSTHIFNLIYLIIVMRFSFRNCALTPMNFAICRRKNVFSLSNRAIKLS